MLRFAFLVAVAAALVTGQPETARAQQTLEISLTIKDGNFDPAEIEVPPIRRSGSNSKTLSLPVEFESTMLRFEKIVTAGSEVTVNVRAQKPGRYESSTMNSAKVDRSRRRSREMKERLCSQP